MNRIDRIFAELKQSDGRALMPFVTAGDPDLVTTARLLPVLQEAGASICEIGIPFSDPIADGPTIQASMSRALAGAVTVEQIMQMVAQQRAAVDIGLVAMVSYSIVCRIGDERFVAMAKEAGFDGFIFPDLPIEEGDALIEHVREAGLICSMLIAPTTPIERAQAIAKRCTGFVYLLSRAGITGEQATLPPDLPERVAALREVTDLPICVGFGISNAEQVQSVVNVADAAIVGSAIVRRIAETADQGTEAVLAETRRFVSELAGGLVAESSA